MATDVDIPLATLAAYCGDTDGCTIRIGYRYSRYSDNTPIPAVVWGPPCPTQIDATGDWATSFFCQQNYTVATGSFQPYVSDVFGVDDDGDATYPRVLSYTSGALAVCELSEAGRSSDTGDTEPMLHFRMTSSTPAAFNHASRTCELVIED
jgi:hypothetical protein